MKANPVVLAVLCSALLLACSEENNTPAKTDSSSAIVPASTDQQSMPAVALKNSCDACHAINTKKVGPAWMDVSKKYKSNPDAEALLIAKVRKGGAGVWGKMPMPPNVTPSEAEIKELVEYILKLSK